MNFLPRHIKKIIVPPIKCQGIKTKLVSFIAKNIEWNEKGKWVEPFLGSGVVAFNIQPSKALLADSNKHIIKFYQQIQKKKINKHSVTEALYEMGNDLKKRGGDYYYEIRSRFNEKADSMDFLFLNRSCFNGLMRFNGKGEFNLPFGHKPNRFAKAYITKIANQVERVSAIIHNNDWEFQVADWKETFLAVKPDDFVYLDPPYIGRHTDYYNTWGNEEAIELSFAAAKLSSEYALSMWLENKYRKNDHIKEYWKNTQLVTMNHFYHVGSTESLRNSMLEALVLKQTSSGITL